MEINEIFMKRCLELAACGIGYASPNPFVGAVIVHNNEIIGEGFHKLFGGPHAEVNAINSIKNKKLLTDSTLYVNLEPCSHYGKTPPCANLIIENKIPRVVVACLDPNPLVAGRGIKILNEAGIETICNVLQNEAQILNRRFLCYHTKKRPYITLKWAETADAFIDINRQKNSNNSNKISNPSTDILVHKWRSEEMAILVGSNTILNDNPLLNLRHWHGQNPIRIVVSKTYHDFSNYNVANNDTKTIFIQPLRNENINNLEYVKIPATEINAETICKILYERNINSVLVEGGQCIHNMFIKSNIWDEAKIIKGDINFHEGLKAANLINAKKIASLNIESDTINFHHNLSVHQ